MQFFLIAGNLKVNMEDQKTLESSWFCFFVLKCVFPWSGMPYKMGT